MSEVKISLNDARDYNVEEVITNFKNYFDIYYEELLNLFSNYSIIEKRKIKDYITSNQDKMWENRTDRFGKKPKQLHNIEDIIYKRMIDYEFLSQKLAVLAHKGKNYLYLLKYIADVQDIFCEDEFYKRIFNNLNISHFGKLMEGSELNQILIPINHIAKEMKIILNQINNLETYNRQKLDSMALFDAKIELYAFDTIADDKEIYTDNSGAVYRTTFHCKKRKKFQ